MTERLYCLTRTARLPKHAGERARREERNNGIFNMERDKGIGADADLNLRPTPAPVSFSHPLTVRNCKSAHMFFFTGQLSDKEQGNNLRMVLPQVFTCISCYCVNARLCVY